MGRAEVVALDGVWAAVGGEVLDELELVPLAHVDEAALDVGVGEGEHLLDELALALGAPGDAHAKDLGVEADGLLDVADHETGVEE